MLMTTTYLSGRAGSSVRLITGSGLGDLVTCERRFYLDVHGDEAVRDQVNEFVQLLWRNGHRHEAEVIGAMGEITDLREVSLASRALATLDAMARRAPVIVGARFELDDRVGMPDVVMLVDGIYFAGDVKSGGPFAANGIDPNHAYGIQIAFYARLLADGGWGSGAQAFVIGGDGELIWFDMDAPMRGGGASLASQVEALTVRARAIRDGVEGTTAAACAMCGLCVWKTACKEELRGRDDPTLIAGLGRAARGQLASVATSVAGLAALPMGDEAPSVRGVGRARLDTFVERARSLATPGAGPYAIRPLGLARWHHEFHLDLETDPTDGAGLCYLHGIHERVGIGADMQERYVHFLAADHSQERDAFAAAMAFLNSEPRALITTYSAFERTTYRQLQRRYPEVATEAEVEALFEAPRGLDLYFGAVLPSTVWPLGSMGLKAIARHLGFDWSDEGAGGAASISWFVEWRETGDPALLERILTYNRQDCEASAVVFDGLIALPVRAPLPWPPVEGADR